MEEYPIKSGPNTVEVIKEGLNFSMPKPICTKVEKHDFNVVFYDGEEFEDKDHRGNCLIVLQRGVEVENNIITLPSSSLVQPHVYNQCNQLYTYTLGIVGDCSWIVVLKI